jgi:hypothetical protein
MPEPQMLNLGCDEMRILAHQCGLSRLGRAIFLVSTLSHLPGLEEIRPDASMAATSRTAI